MKDVDKAIKGGGERTYIDIQVSANSKRSAVTGVDPWRGRLTLEVKAKPVSGRANREVIHIFARLFGVPAGDVAITAGARSRQKTVAVKLDPERVMKVLEGL